MINFAIQLISEFLGTLLLILTIVASGGSSVMTGAVLALIIFLTAGVSGGHMNPVVSLAMYLSGSISAAGFAGYTVAQALGGITAYFIYKVVTS
jgi:glycerol uptake facilitator-like aquaporin